MTAEEFITEGPNGDSPMEKFQAEMAFLLRNRPKDNDVFSVNDVENATREVEILFSSHGSPPYPEARLNGLIIVNRQRVRVLWQELWPELYATFLYCFADCPIHSANAMEGD